MQIWKRPSSSHYQEVTFADGSFLFFHSIVSASPILIETKCHWKSNVTQSGAIGQMRRGSDISDFLFHFCSRPLKNPRVVFSLIQYFKRDRACQSCLWGWQLPWGTLTVQGPLFLFETSHMLGHLLWNSENSVNQQRIKCRGLPFKTSGVPEAKWSVGLYEHASKKAQYEIQEGAYGLEELG